METPIQEIQLFFEKIELINFKYDKIIRDNEYDFNIFSILRKERDEVYLHSRFLYELLNPNGAHNQGTIFLNLFLESIDLSNFDTQNESLVVKREYENIDIYIANEKQAIIIENKIDAKDRDKQLEGYYETIEQKGFDDINVIYLTLYGDDPSEQSVGKLKERNKKIKLISYRYQIDKWIERCIKEIALYPILRETLLQYQRLIQTITGKHHSMEYIMEIKELLMNEKNFRYVVDINQALIEAKIDIQYAFWQELASSLKKLGCKISDDGICTKEKVEAFYKNSGNNRHYGIYFTLFNLDEKDKLSFAIQLDWKICYGFWISRDGNEYSNNKDPKYDYLSDIIKNIDKTFERQEYWLACKHPNRPIDFDNFSDDNSLSLADESKRLKFVDELSNEIKDIIHRFNVLYKK